MSFDQLRGSDRVNCIPDQVGRTFLRTYENHLCSIDIILLQKGKFCVYKKVFWDQRPNLPGFRVVCGPFNFNKQTKK